MSSFLIWFDSLITLHTVFNNRRTGPPDHQYIKKYKYVYLTWFWLPSFDLLLQYLLPSFPFHWEHPIRINTTMSAILIFRYIWQHTAAKEWECSFSSFLSSSSSRYSSFTFFLIPSSFSSIVVTLARMVATAQIYSYNNSSTAIYYLEKYQNENLMELCQCCQLCVDASYSELDQHPEN